MSFAAGFDAKEQVRQAIDIVDLVGSYVPLRRQGRNLVGLCPWHDDSRPSLQVNPERQTYRCWVCDVGGDVFSFVMQAEGVEFREALEMLAERAGIALQPQPAPGSAGDGAGQSRAKGPDKQTLYRAMAWAERVMHQFLLESPEAESARAYLAKRGISPETVRRFYLGYTPDRWDWLLGEGRKAQWPAGLLERIGLVIRRDEGDGYYDRFRGRLMFSIRDAQSRPIAFGGRVLAATADERSPKYINSPETPLFSKSRELYGLDAARQAISATKQAIVMEGYTDCLMAHQHGIENVVAVLGTALGERHLPSLRLSDSITLVLDGDEAGRRRSLAIVDDLLALFVHHDVNLRVLTLPNDVDPCDFIASQGRDAFLHLLDTAVDALEHKLRTVTNGLAVPSDPHHATEAVESLLVSVAKLRPPGGRTASKSMLREQEMLSFAARHFRLPEKQLRHRLEELRRQARVRPVQAAKTDGKPEGNATDKTVLLSRWPAWERELMEVVLLEPKHLEELGRTIERDNISTLAARELFEAALALWQGGVADVAERLLLETEDPAMKRLLVQLEERAHEKSESDLAMRLEHLRQAHQRICEQRQWRADAAARSGGADDDRLLIEYIQKRRPAPASDSNPSDT